MVATPNSNSFWSILLIFLLCNKEIESCDYITSNDTYSPLIVKSTTIIYNQHTPYLSLEFSYSTNTPSTIDLLLFIDTLTLIKLHNPTQYKWYSSNILLIPITMNSLISSRDEITINNSKEIFACNTNQYLTSSTMFISLSSNLTSDTYFMINK
eukprot:73625_1